MSPKKKDGEDKKKTEFRIRDLPDLRRLRNAYLKKGKRPVGVDSNDTPRPEDAEDDFGLKRSTAEEAWEFYRQAIADAEGGDELTEFLDDD